MFCRIARGEIPAEQVYRSEGVLAFRDINPAAPTHVLVIPTRHVGSADELDDPALGGRLFAAASEVARSEGLAERGYRLVVNTGPDAGQSVDHLHIHVLGGRALSWPPG